MRTFWRVIVVLVLLFLTFSWAIGLFSKKENGESVSAAHVSSLAKSNRSSSFVRQRESRFTQKFPELILTHWDEKNYRASEETFAEWLAISDQAAIVFISQLEPPYEVPHFSYAIYRHLKDLTFSEAWEASCSS